MKNVEPFILPEAFTRLNLAQACGALNDNMVKLLLVFYLVNRAGHEQAGTIAAIGSGLFILPFLLFSALAGSLADRLAKQRIIVAVKCVEIGIVILAVAGVALDNHTIIYAVVFLLGSHSALFTPAKYGVVPELVARDQLSRANSLLEMATYLGIVGGTALAPILLYLSGSRYTFAVSAGIVVALAGLVFARALPVTPVADAVRPLA